MNQGKSTTKKATQKPAKSTFPTSERKAAPKLCRGRFAGVRCCHTQV